MVFLVILGVVLLAGMIYLAVSRHSSFQVRVAALIALFLMVLTVILCILFFFKASAAPKILMLPDTLPSDIPPPQKQNVLATMMMILALVAMFVMVLVLSLREQSRSKDSNDEDVSNKW
jgi:ABC-type Fe3+ transport system permease subunit